MALASFASSSSASGPSRHWMLVWGSGSAGGQQMVSDFGLRVIGNRRLTISWPNPARQALTAAAGFPRLIPPNSFRINPVDCRALLIAVLPYIRYVDATMCAFWLTRRQIGV